MAGGKIKKENGGSRHGYQSGIPFRKSKGQHVLKNPMLVDSIVQKAGIKSTDIVLEIGPGTGNLTKKLLEVGKTVIAVEVDPRMILELQRRFQGTPLSNRLKVIQGDILKCKLPYFDICVANIPYQISSPLTFRLLAHRPSFRCAVIMFQREFAMRLVARPGDSLYSRLSVNVQLLARVSHLLKVGRNNFRPPPRVDSSVVRIEPRKPLPPINLRDWGGLLHLCFCRKNKTLGSIFRQKSVLNLLRKNYTTFKAMDLVPSGSIEDDDADISALGVSFDELQIDGTEEDGHHDMDVCDSETPDLAAFKDKVLLLLTPAGFVDKRSVKLTQEDFLHLLSIFNKAGFHFA